jgi:hypothetical protein
MIYEWIVVTPFPTFADASLLEHIIHTGFVEGRATN